MNRPLIWAYLMGELTTLAFVYAVFGEEQGAMKRVCIGVIVALAVVVTLALSSCGDSHSQWHETMQCHHEVQYPTWFEECSDHNETCRMYSFAIGDWKCGPRVSPGV
jgi:hypothetical protein